MAIPRKILVRVVGAPLLLGVLGGILYVDHARHSTMGLRLLLFAVCTVASLEFHGFCRAKGIATAHVVGSIATALAPMAVGLRTAQDVPLAWPPLALAGGLTLVLLLKTVFRYGSFPPEGAALTLLGSVYVGMIALVLTPPSSGPVAWYLLFLVATGKGSDMAAYVAGKSIGRHKFAPVVSPNKTWEGTIAGALAGTAAGLAVLKATPLAGSYCTVPLPALLGFALLATMAGQVGDLVKSALKRWAGVKDSGSLLPEFGGMLDMCDSFLLSVPVCHGASLVLFALFKGA